MIKFYVTVGNDTVFSEAAEPQKNCWIYMEAPTSGEIFDIAKLTNVPEQFLKSALDEEESAHLDVEDGAKLTVIDIPKMGENGTVFTLPLAIIQTDDYFITVCTTSTSVVTDFLFGKIKNVGISSKTKLIYQIMYNNSVRFLYYLRQIDKASDRIQKNFTKSVQNKELIQLLDMQKSLVFFSSSLTANFALIQKIANIAKYTITEEERDIIEDVIIENRQAIEMCSVYREVMKSAMDAFASVVNNNQNTVMKVLTAITIILSVPMVVSGFWGMNTGVPFGGKLWGFWAAVGISSIMSLLISFFMIKKKLL